MMNKNLGFSHYEGKYTDNFLLKNPVEHVGYSQFNILRTLIDDTPTKLVKNPQELIFPSLIPEFTEIKFNINPSTKFISVLEGKNVYWAWCAPIGKVISNDQDYIPEIILTEDSIFWKYMITHYSTLSNIAVEQQNPSSFDNLVTRIIRHFTFSRIIPKIISNKEILDEEFFLEDSDILDKYYRDPDITLNISIILRTIFRREFEIVRKNNKIKYKIDNSTPFDKFGKGFSCEFIDFLRIFPIILNRIKKGDILLGTYNMFPSMFKDETSIKVFWLIMEDFCTKGYTQWIIS